MLNDGICYMIGVSVVVLFNNFIDVFFWKEILSLLMFEILN